MEFLDFDDLDYADFHTRARDVGLVQLVDKIAGGYLVETPRGGRHLGYRCEVIAGNKKLASKPEVSDGKKGSVQVLVETKGERGYVVSPPSGGTVHKSGKPYVWLQGGPDTITTITRDERDDILDLARSFNQLTRTEFAPQDASDRTRGDHTRSDRPGDDFNHPDPPDRALTMMRLVNRTFMGKDRRATPSALCVIGACVNDNLTSSRSSSILVIDRIGAARGGTNEDPTPTFLQSDVLTDGDVFDDIGRVTTRLALKDPGTPENPTSPTSANYVTVTRYRVAYRCNDGRHTPGVDVPFPIDGPVTFTTVTGTQSAEFILVRSSAKLEAPLRALAGGGGAIVINATAEITFYGTDQTGPRWKPRGQSASTFLIGQTTRRRDEDLTVPIETVGGGRRGPCRAHVVVLCA